MFVSEEELCHHMKIFVHVNPENNEEKDGGCHKMVRAVDQDKIDMPLTPLLFNTLLKVQAKGKKLVNRKK
jgi:hypothetical protein